MIIRKSIDEGISAIPGYKSSGIKLFMLATWRRVVVDRDQESFIVSVRFNLGETNQIAGITTRVKK